MMQKCPIFASVSKNTIKKKRDRLHRCVSRIRETYESSPTTLETDFDQQDIIVLNLQRACEQAIDIAQLTARKAGLRSGDTSAEVFEVLAEAGIIPKDLNGSIKGMIGFRNIAVHEYEKLDFVIVRSVITEHVSSLILLADICSLYLNSGEEE